MAATYSGHSTMLSCIRNICPIEPEDLFLNDLLDEKPESPQYVCGCCDECAPATSQCKDCNEMLCNNCVRAHVRVRLTKDHHIVSLDGSQISPTIATWFKPTTNSTSNAILNGSAHCDVHVTEPLSLYCETCCSPVCVECSLREHGGHLFVYMQDAIEGARISSLKLLSEAKSGAKSFKDSLEMTQRQLDTLNINAHTVARDVRSTVHKFQVALDERERELIMRIESIRMTKQKGLMQQIEILKSALSYYNHATELLSDVLEVGTASDILQAREATFPEIKRLRSVPIGLQTIDEDILFTQPDPSVFRAVANLGEISSFNGQQAGTSALGSDGLLRNVARQGYGVHKSSLVDDVQSGTDPLGQFMPGVEQPLEQEDPKVNLWTSLFRNKLDIPVNQGVVPRSQPPHTSSVCMYVRDYTETGRPQVVFGGEGENDGQLCRPWGVCSDLEGNIIVADRSNNRIQIFRSDGTFVRKFGNHGSEPGNFDRPAGVATDPSGRIVVTDKDNHRVQVFTPEGRFVFMFGEKGGKVGQFNYPWDVAVDTKGRIAVSDTRNHRIQLFTSDGSFLYKYGFENSASMWKHFDSPRGICFGTKGCVIVTDFNNHKLVVIDSNFRNARFLGTEGSGVKQFLRPQGVAVDSDGNIIVADSRNNRIQIFEQNGSFLWQFGVPGKEPGQLDRPSGVCLTPDGKIVVVDFGNNRIQIF